MNNITPNNSTEKRVLLAALSQYQRQWEKKAQEMKRPTCSRSAWERAELRKDTARELINRLTGQSPEETELTDDEYQAIARAESGHVQ